jgi:hypothetical protein
MVDQEDTVPRIDTNTDLEGFFRNLVGTAARDCGVSPTFASEGYLAALLADCARAHSDPLSIIGGESLTLLLAKALDEHGARRFEQLRLLGDGVLYLSGFFAEHLERRGLEPQYVSGLGATAYGRASSMLRRFGTGTAPDVFAELADNFAAFVRLVTNVSEQLAGQAVRDHGSLLDVYERWIKTSSAALSQILLDHGVLPTRGKPGLH